jgi:hypothetical protein
LLIATDHGLYYVPESQTNPFRATSMAFFPFGSSWPITASAKMRSFDDGVLSSCRDRSSSWRARPAT